MLISFPLQASNIVEYIYSVWIMEWLRAARSNTTKIERSIMIGATMIKTLQQIMPTCSPIQVCKNLARNTSTYEPRGDPV